MHFDQDLTIVRNRLFNLFELEDIGRTEIAIDNCLHWIRGCRGPIAVVSGCPVGNLEPDEHHYQNRNYTPFQYALYHNDDESIYFDNYFTSGVPRFQVTNCFSSLA